MTNVNYPCGCSASEGCPNYCPVHMTAMPLIREYAQFMYEAGYNNTRPDGDYSNEVADFERRIAELSKPQQLPDDAARAAVFDVGFRLAATWANRYDLFPDVDSPQYKEERAALLAAMAAQKGGA